jgi:hypothetical protein
VPQAPVELFVISDGTPTRPHCSWQNTCTWDRTTQENCARRLCEAAGHASGTFMSASNDMCVSSFTDQPFHYYAVDTGQYVSTTNPQGNEAQITANCQQTGAAGLAPTMLAAAGASPFAVPAAPMAAAAPLPAFVGIA